MNGSIWGSRSLVHVLALVSAVSASACALETDDDADADEEVAQADSAITAGRLTTLAQNKTAYFLAVDTNNVYWTDASAGKLQRVPRAGGDIVTLAKDLRQPAAVAVDSTSVYWAETGNPTSPNCKIKSTIKTGGFAPRTIYEGPHGCVGLAIDTDRVVFTNAVRGTVMRVDKGGSGLTTLYSGGGKPIEVVTDGTNAYWTDIATGEIKGTKGRSIIVLAKNQSPQSLVISGDYVYWTNPVNGTVRRSYRHASYDDGDFVETGVKTIASGQAGPTGIATNGSWIYWTNIAGGSLMRSRTDGSYKQKLATIPVGAIHLELETRAPRNPPSAFWVSPSAGTVSKMDFYL